MSKIDPIVIVGAARTPMGGFQGDLKDAPAPQLAPVPAPSVSAQVASVHAVGSSPRARTAHELVAAFVALSPQ